MKGVISKLGSKEKAEKSNWI